MKENKYNDDRFFEQRPKGRSFIPSKEEMMPQDTSRGYVPSDKKEFNGESLPLLQATQRDIHYLLNRGYDLERSVTFVGNRFQFSARQRTALMRATAPAAILEHRGKRLASGRLAGETVYIDGFNLIITLEAALSPETTLLRCMDGTVRDLCGLHGTYRIIEATSAALSWIGEALIEKGAGRAVCYLDAPVSNSGRLRAAILETMERCGLPCEVHLAPNADAMLWGKENVISSDSILLDRCGSWLNLACEIIAAKLPERRTVDLSMNAD